MGSTPTTGACYPARDSRGAFGHAAITLRRVPPTATFPCFNAGPGAPLGAARPGGGAGHSGHMALRRSGGACHLRPAGPSSPRWSPRRRSLALYHSPMALFSHFQAANSLPGFVEGFGPTASRWPDARRLVAETQSRTPPLCDQRHGAAPFPRRAALANNDVPAWLPRSRQRVPLVDQVRFEASTGCRICALLAHWGGGHACGAWPARPSTRPYLSGPPAASCCL